MSLSHKLEPKESGYNQAVLQGVAIAAPADIFEKIHSYLRSNYQDAYELNRISCTGNSRPDGRNIVFEMIGRLPQEEVNDIGEFIRTKFPELYESKLKRYNEVNARPRIPVDCNEGIDKRYSLSFERDF